MYEKTVTVLNKAGIHCRPSSAILMAAMGYSQDHKMQAICARGVSSLGSILELLSLGLQCGESVTVKVEGPKESEIGSKLAELFAHEFDFPPKD